MKFIDKYVFKEDRFSIGIEQDTGKYYISIPVNNGLVDYEEYYEIDKGMFDHAPDNYSELLAFVKECRLHHEDDRLIVKPGSKRGDPV